MTSYDGLTMTPTPGLVRTPRPSRPSTPTWLPAAGWALGLVVVVVGAAFGGALLVVSSLGVAALVTGMAATVVRWRRTDRLAAVQLTERRASIAESRLAREPVTSVRVPR